MQTPRVLVVDDEDSIRFFLGKLLERKGCEIQLAASAEEAIEMLSTVSPDVALVDIVLPGKSGMELTEHIRKHAPDCQIVIITSHGSFGRTVEAIQLGAYDYLDKPFSSLEDVWATIQRALKSRDVTSRGLAPEAGEDRVEIDPPDNPDPLIR